MRNVRPMIGGLAAVALAVSLGGCQQTRQALGLEKTAPDEFQVVARAPLSLPPDYNLLPPQPGVARPQEGTTRDQAESAVFGDASGGGFDLGGALGYGVAPAVSAASPGESAASPGESALLQNAGAVDVDPTIRRQVDLETAQLIEQDKRFIDRLIFWRDPAPYGTVVDPEQEQQRLQENAALGRPATAGETPTIERKRRALLEGIF